MSHAAPDERNQAPAGEGLKSPKRSQAAPPRKPPVAVILLFLTLAGAIGIGGYIYYRTQADMIWRRSQNEISAVADLKVRGLSAWLEERRSDAFIFSSSELFARIVQRCLENRLPPVERAELRGTLSLMQGYYDYVDIVLLDTKGVVRLSVGAGLTMDPTFQEAVGRAASEDSPVFVDLHSRPGGEINMGFVARLPSPDSHQKTIGFIAFQIDPERFLFPHIQTWPVASPTAETLLVRREGSKVVFLNRLRHRADKPLSLKLPLKEPALPAAAAASGNEGLFTGVDYRGVPVLAALRREAKTRWFLVAKVDEAEVLAPLRTRAAWSASVSIGLIAAAGVMAILLWRRQQLFFYKEQWEAEARHKATVGHYDYLSRYANDIILLFAESGEILEANERAISTYGYTRDEFQGLKIPNLRDPSNHTAFSEQWQGVFNSEGVVWEAIHRRKDGSAFPVEVSARLIDVDGEKFFLAIIRDITERKQAEDALRESEAVFRGFFNSSNVRMSIVELTDDDDLLYVMPNKTMAEFYGLTVEQLAGKTLADIGLKTGVVLEWAERLRQSHASGSGVKLEYPIVLQGTTCWFHTSASPIPSGGSGRPRFSLVAVSITELKRTEEALRKSQASLAHAQELAALGSWELEFTLSQTGELEETHWWSDEMFRIFGYSPRCWSPSREIFLSRIHPEDREWVLRSARAAMAADDNFEASHRVIRPDGSVRHVRERVELVRDPSGRVVRMAGAVQDLTEYKQLEEQLLQSRKLESLGRLSGGIAHDFNNLLTVINGYSDLLLKKFDHGDPVTEKLGEIKKAGEDAARLTQQLLAFSRGQLLQPAVVDLNRIIAETEKMLRRLIGEDIDLMTGLSPSIGMIHADASQIHQVILNLAVNARDAMPTGGTLLIETSNVELDETHAETHAEVKPGQYVLLAVSDTGVGMTAEVRSRVFEPFFTTKEIGTGLGLATVHGIVKQSGGSIWVYTEAGKGTTFKIYLPRVEGLASPAPLPVRESASLRGSETVLVVEDQPEVRKFTVAALEEYGYKVLEAGEANEAMAVSERHPGPVHLLLTDVVMPGLNGPELAERLTVLRPEMKVLYVSGYTERAVLQRGLLDLTTAYIQKPFSPAAVAAKVRQTLSKGESRKSILVVDDNPSVRRLLASVLEAGGYAVIEASNGKEALARLESHPVDLVATDLIMPEQEGLETIQVLHQRNPEIKIVAISGAFHGQFLPVARFFGAHATLQKPVEPEKLLETVRSLLS